jgi:ATP-dependent Lon protease
MTGEITLRGRVLPVGGIKEKVLAAHRSGMKTVILPKRNEHDLEDIPEEVVADVEFVLAETIDDVLKLSLVHTEPSLDGPAAAESRPRDAKEKRIAKVKTDAPQEHLT